MKTLTSFLFIMAAIIILTACTTEPTRLFSGDPEYPLTDQVTLLDGPFRDAMERTHSYLFELEPDRLLHHFRLNAGLDTIAPAYAGWEERELRGHTTGHYLSACAMMYLATGDSLLLERVNYIVNALAECQSKNGNGYLSAFPEEFIDRAERMEEVWAPYYTLHKIMAGLYDSYHLLGNSQALEVLKAKADWLYSRSSRLEKPQMQAVLDRTEQGGMNEVLYNLYSATDDSKYLELGGMFTQDSYFSPIRWYRDSLKGQHSNSFIPNVVGLMRHYEVTGSVESYRMAEWFWNQVTTARSYVTGGTSNGEHWNSEPFHMHTELGPTSHETCCTYNMLKLTKHLFRANPTAGYMDYYEKALWNGILPTQHPDSRMTMYYVPMEAGYYKTFSTPENSFWCCTGSGMENFARTGESIYMTGNNRLYINQFIASSLTIPEADFTISQETNFPDGASTSLMIETRSPASFVLAVRVPSWTGEDYSVTINGKEVTTLASPGSYLEIDRTWENGDLVTLTLPMKLHLESLPADHRNMALMYGPVVMAAELSDTSLTQDKVYGRYGPYMDVAQAVIPTVRISDRENPSTDFASSGNNIFTAASGSGDSLTFIPFYRLFDKRYMIYFKPAE